MYFNRTLVFFILLTVINVNYTMAQEKIAGVYRVSSGNPEGGNTFFVLENHTFAVAFFGGVITGAWSMDGKQVNFKPFISEHKFYIYGRHNKDLKDSTRIYFQGFDEQPTYLGFGENDNVKPTLQAIYNESPNCVPYPSVVKFKDLPTQLLFSDQPFIDGEVVVNSNVYTFDNPEKYNDFITHYFRDEQDRNPFSAEFKDNKMFFEHETKGSTKYPIPTEGEDIDFITKILNAPKTTDQVFYNPFYKTSQNDVNDKLKWKFDDQKNAFINFQNYEEGEEYRPDEQDAYNNMNIVYQFNMLKLAEKKVKPFAINPKPLIIATCN